MKTFCRLGHGDFYQAHLLLGNVAVEHERVLFLTAVARAAPAVLRTLQELLPTHRSAVDRGPAPELWSQVSIASDRVRSYLSPLKTTLTSWATAWHLDESWVLDVAIRTLRVWADHPRSRDCLRWSLSPSGFRFALTPEEESSYRLAVREHESTAEWEKIAGERGFSRTPVKRNPVHYQWLVKWQVLGWTYPRIARDANADQRTVIDATALVARSIRLRRRVGVRGRPSALSNTVPR